MYVGDERLWTYKFPSRRLRKQIIEDRLGAVYNLEHGAAVRRSGRPDCCLSMRTSLPQESAGRAGPDFWTFSHSRSPKAPGFNSDD